MLVPLLVLPITGTVFPGYEDGCTFGDVLLGGLGKFAVENARNPLRILLLLATPVNITLRDGDSRSSNFATVVERPNFWRIGTMSDEIALI